MANSLIESRRRIILNSPHIASSSGQIVTVNDAIKAKLKSCVVDINPVQSGTGDPSPDNIRPISGWDGANVERCGKNVWNEQWELGAINTNTGNNTPSDTNIRSKYYVRIKGGTNYRFGSSQNVNILFYDMNKGYLNNITKKNGAITTPENACFLRLSFSSAYGTTYLNDTAINYPSTITTYESYTGTTYPITFPSEAGTVYGGTLDVTNGVLRALVKGYTFNQLRNSLSYDLTYSRFISNQIARETKRPPESSVLLDGLMCECYTPRPATNAGSDPINYSIGITATGFLVFRDTRYTNVLNLLEEIGKYRVVFPLAAPLTYQLTPTEISTLLGVNNVWADTGDISVKYWAHP